MKLIKDRINKEKKMKKIFTIIFLSLFFTNCSFADVATSKATAKKAPTKTYNVAWSHYTGWEPWEFAKQSGVLKKWADKYGINIKLTLINDYIESINLYTSGKYDACVMTNMDALTIPAVGGVDSTALIIGDFSNGNDGIVTHVEKTIPELKGKQIKLVELSVSHYLLSRALTQNGLKERDVKLLNTSDADIGSIFMADPTGIAVTWNPILSKLRNSKGAQMIYDSSKIPGEIIDMMVVKTSADENLKKALSGAWYETMKIMSSSSKEGKAALEIMAKSAGGTLDEFKAQLKTTKMFYNAKDAVAFSKSPELKKTMDYVRTFSFDQGLFGDGASDKNFVGIELPDSSVLGNKKNIKLRFTSKYMQMAAEGNL